MQKIFKFNESVLLFGTNANAVGNKFCKKPAACNAVIEQVVYTADMKVVHEIAPVWNHESRILILGTMPSPASRAAGFFYMHGQNRFWPIMERLFDERFRYKNNAVEKECAVSERQDFLLRRRIAMWDVLAACSIEGAADSSIKDAVPNDFSAIFAASKIHCVFCTGKTAFRLYQKLCAARYAVPCSCLPSTSAANRARWPEDELLAAYERVKTAAEEA